MRKSRNWFHTMEIVLAVIVVFLAFIMLREKNKEDFQKVSVIVRNAEDHQWSAFRYGLKMAAQDHKIELVVVSTGDVLTEDEEIDTIKSEIEDGADAVIVQPVSGNYIEKELKKMEKKVPVMLVECTASKEKEKSLLPSVEPDHEAMGRTLAEELCTDYNGNLSGKTYGIVTEGNQTEAERNRKKGLETILKDAGAEFRWDASDFYTKTGENSLEDQPKVDFVIALDNQSLITASEYAAANNLHGALVYGIGNSTEAVYYLDTGIVECLVVSDEFYAGYLSLTEIAKRFGHYFYKMESQTVSHTVIRRKELFDKKNQEILFTMSQ